MSRALFEPYAVEVRLHRRKPRGEPLRLSTPQAVYEFVRPIEDLAREEFYALLVSTKHYLQGVYKAGAGGINTCTVDPFTVYQACLLSNSPNYIAVHNHPSGDPTPSPDDITLMHRLRAGGLVLNITLSDFLIVGCESRCGRTQRNPQARLRAMRIRVCGIDEHGVVVVLACIEDVELLVDEISRVTPVESAGRCRVDGSLDVEPSLRFSLWP
jgi:DNA repair protein RadC